MTLPQLPTIAYVDTPATFAVALGEEPAGTAVQRRLGSFRYLVSANLLETELRTALRYEGTDFDDSAITEITWIYPNRRLDTEMAAVLEIAYLSPIRVWHLAVAMFFRDVMQSEIAFVTLEEQQETVARELGFWIP